MPLLCMLTEQEDGKKDSYFWALLKNVAKIVSLGSIAVDFHAIFQVKVASQLHKE